MITVGSESQGLVVVTEMLPGKRTGTVCEHDVVLCEAFFYCRWRGHHQHFESPKSEEYDWAVFLSEFVEGAVNGWLYEVKMAYDRQATWARWQVFALLVSSQYQG